MIQLLFSPKKYVILKKRFICTIVVSRQIHVLTDTRMLRTILGRTFMAATLQHSTLLPGNGSVCDSILELYAILEFHTQDDHYSKIYHYYSKGRLLRVSLGLHALLFLVAKIVVLYSLYYTTIPRRLTPLLHAFQLPDLTLNLLLEYRKLCIQSTAFPFRLNCMRNLFVAASRNSN